MGHWSQCIAAMCSHEPCEHGHGRNSSGWLRAPFEEAVAPHWVSATDWRRCMRPLLLVLVLSFGVAGCSQQTVSSPPSNAVLALPPAHAAVTLTTIYSFKSSPDGQGPVAGVTLFAGKFYGTTL